MQIHGTSNVHGAQGIQGPQANRNGVDRSAAANAAAPADQVEISPTAQAAVNAAEGADYRADLVARVKSEIQSGTYETADKLEGALNRFLDESV